MKKFLFTLAALLMAGSALAQENYMYIDNFNVTEADLGKSIEVTVKAHFDNRVSACQLDLQLPEGLSIYEFWEGADSDIDYFTNTGRQRTVTAGWTNVGTGFMVITSATVQGYYQLEDGTWASYGALKWEPGDYEEMLVIVLNVADDFDYTQKNVPVTVVSMPSSGQDPRGNTVVGTPTFTQTNYVNYEEGPQGPEDFVGTANVEFVGSVAQLSYTSNDPNANVVVTCDDKEVEVNWVENNGTYTATYNVEESTELGNHSSIVTLTVTPDGENFVGEPASDNATYSYTVTTDFDAEVEVVFNGNVASLTYVANDEAAVPTVYVNGVETAVEWNNGEATYTVTESTVPGTYNVTVELSVAPGNQFIIGEPISDSDTYTYTVQAKTEKPVITIVDQNAHHCNFTVQGEGTVLVYVDGVLVQPVDGVYTVYAVEGQPVDYVITATAQGENMLISDVASKPVHFDAWDGVDELVNGKTVAGVRYFNMAGQEMQEANGMTIVVTTYTDGTTSAVKVMK